MWIVRQNKKAKTKKHRNSALQQEEERARSIKFKEQLKECVENGIIEGTL
jgi:hypothetical protein